TVQVAPPSRLTATVAESASPLTPVTQIPARSGTSTTSSTFIGGPEASGRTRRVAGSTTWSGQPTNAGMLGVVDGPHSSQPPAGTFAVGVGSTVAAAHLVPPSVLSSRGCPGPALLAGTDTSSSVRAARTCNSPTATPAPATSGLAGRCVQVRPPSSEASRRCSHAGHSSSTAYTWAPSAVSAHATGPDGNGCSMLGNADGDPPTSAPEWRPGRLATTMPPAATRPTTARPAL